MKVKKINEKAKVLVENIGSYYTIHWQSPKYEGYVEIMDGSLVTATKYQRGRNNPLPHADKIPPSAEIVAIVKGYVGPTLYQK